jgi:hypothetical protein
MKFENYLNSWRQFKMQTPLETFLVITTITITMFLSNYIYERDSTNDEIDDVDLFILF